MLKDELQGIRQTLAASPAVSVLKLNMLSREVTSAWQNADFSDAPEHTLRRYLNFHLASLTSFSNELSERKDSCSTIALSQTLLDLTDHLLNYYGNYIDLAIAAPEVFVQRTLDAIRCKVNRLKISDESVIRNWLIRFFQDLPVGIYSFRRLNFLMDLLNVMQQNHHNEEELLFALVSINFNHLGFYAALTKSFERLDLELLKILRKKLHAVPLKIEAGFDASWTPLKDLLIGWLKEEICLKQDAVAPAMERLYLELSVAHLACFVRLLYEEGLMAAANLKDVFRHICGTFRTKRQPAISEGSFSKEFYGIDQHTAARVRDMLQKMITRIDRKYFP